MGFNTAAYLLMASYAALVVPRVRDSTPDATF